MAVTDPRKVIYIGVVKLTERVEKRFFYFGSYNFLSRNVRFVAFVPIELHR